MGCVRDNGLPRGSLAGRLGWDDAIHLDRGGGRGGARIRQHGASDAEPREREGDRDSLAAQLAVSSPASPNLLSIACTMPEPAAAQRCAAAVAQAYANFRNDTASSALVRAHDSFSVTIVTPALLPSTPTGTSKLVVLSLGAVLGLALGVGTAFVRDRLDDRVRDRGDLERCLDAPVLAAIPRVRRSAGPASVFRSAPLSRAAEAYRHLR